MPAIEEFGLRCLLAVASHAGPEPIRGPEIVRREGLGPAYIARITSVLRAGNRVASSRGAAGGDRPACPADRTTSGRAIQALGGESLPEGFCDLAADRLGIAAWIRRSGSS